jgi:hypothetical protein
MGRVPAVGFDGRLMEREASKIIFYGDVDVIGKYT